MIWCVLVVVGFGFGFGVGYDVCLVVLGNYGEVVGVYY